MDLTTYLDNVTLYNLEHKLRLAELLLAREQYTYDLYTDKSTINARTQLTKVNKQQVEVDIHKLDIEKFKTRDYNNLE